MESLHKTFEKQGGIFGTGNVLSDTQVSTFVRPHGQTECNGFVRPPGHLRKYDLKMFGHSLPAAVKNVVVAHKEKYLIIYKFRHLGTGDGCGQYSETVHGWLITDYHHRFVDCYYSGSTYKSDSIIDVARELLCEGDVDGRQQGIPYPSLFVA